MKKYIYTNKDGRIRIIIKNNNGIITSKSYPRMLMEEKLGRPLTPNEDVHHIDGNPLNNNLDNLEIKIHGEHQKEHSTKYYNKLIECDVCGKSFIWTGKQQSGYYRDLKRHKHRGKTCSKRCAYKFGKNEQIRSDSNTECELNGESLPNGNTVPNT